ncbi:FAD-binding oxidoreductase [Erythrobacter sp. SG61-1L]|uniref:FAD-binding oxidoreductase n=1 Tax=Erythrobacter sp. SG61-1L TaxID=1603897 RepID=UPI0006C8E8A8|nr:FAD-binding oxidoreductase [Erythrobacter sp. SG61-1L]
MQSSTLPMGVGAEGFRAALAAFRAALGADGVLDGDEDRTAYLDPYAFGDGLDHESSAILAPAEVAEVQEVVRIANRFGIPLWPVSRGKNFGYGSAAPVRRGDVILDLSRMNRVLEVDAQQANCLIEPGVSFFDLFDHLWANNIPLWMSVPGNSWGSVLGNALDRGIGYTPLGDNCEALCGLEVVMPDGELVRTGMGAVGKGATWRNYKYGYGPGWDQMFAQSNFGIVTKAGLWLQPEPEMTASVEIAFPNFDDAGWAIDILADLRRREIIQHNVVFGSPVRAASTLTQRAEWYEGEGALPEEAERAIMEKYGLGWWNAKISFFGPAYQVEGNMRQMRELFEPKLGKELKFRTWHQGEPYENSARGVPSTLGLQSVNWYGGRGGHLSFAPVMPQDGARVLDYAKRVKRIYREIGQDYYSTFTIGRRHINNVSLILYDRDDPASTGRANDLFGRLVVEAAKDGYTEYRGHIDYMDTIAKTYDFNDHALNRLNNKVKAALDPNNIIAPGRNGIGGTK